MDRFADIEAFTAVVEAGTFSAAGDRLGVAKSVVSRRISQLERRLGSRLLHRTTRRLALTETGKNFYQRAVQVLADLWIDAGQASAGRLDCRVPTGETPHVRRRAAQVRDDAGEARDLVTDVLDLLEDRVLAAALDDAPLVLGDGAEGAAAEAATHDVDREADHFIRRYVPALVGRVRHARIGQPEHVVHFLG